MSNDTTIYVGAYAIVRVPQRTEEYHTYSCPNGCYIDRVMNFCWKCGTKIEGRPLSRTVATSLFDLEEMGIEVGKYHSISYSINHHDVDEPFISEPLILTSNHDDGTALARIDPDEGDCYPWDVIVRNISPDDITRCTANFIRLYFEELKGVGETTVHFGVLKDMEL